MKILLILLLTGIYGLHSIDALSLQNLRKPNANDGEQRIIGGHDAEPHQFPYMVSIHLQGKHRCGGSIISKKWVVSAAHCYHGIEGSKFEVVAGLHDQDKLNYDDVQKIPIVQIIIHPLYYHDYDYEYCDFHEIYEYGYYECPKIIQYDIALLELASPLNFEGQPVRPIALPSAKANYTEGWLTGWGIYKRPGKYPTTLQCLHMQLITNEECHHTLYQFENNDKLILSDTMVCAVPPNGPEIGCSGDSGGPIAQDGVLIGITSWSVNCSKYHIGAPTVFTEVSQFIDFIEQYVHIDEICNEDHPECHNKIDSAAQL